jgi:sulfur-oxidizing protein SoxZ
MANSIKVRAKSNGGVTTIKCLVTHPMEPGNREDKKTGKMIEPHFIQDINIDVNGQSVVAGQFSGGVSKNPYLSCKAKGNPGDKVKISWVDNQGNKDEIETEVK